MAKHISIQFFSSIFTRLVWQERKIVQIRMKNQIKSAVEQTTDDREREREENTANQSCDVKS